MAIVEFDPDAFRELYPQFSAENLEKGKKSLTDGRIMAAFDEACLLLDNSENSLVPYDPEKGIKTREIMFNMLVCHICTIALWDSGQSGPVSQATEGSVSVSFAVPSDGNYWNMTPCGRAFWQAAQKYLIGGRYCAVKTTHPWG